ncbi:tyrosine specific protein phosphatase [Hibiscus syriacus]|uniref:Tyrosine specific protein phosphatase n=1 Tax=Hibiscus syriacus TaxID=106335 RepID=A0A6A2Z2G5_HIBSY|nr:zinc finger CCCH domain-containing protein 3-like isoform X2 [Hibiscus syriacus]XP_039021201.1 zinc finger CCCH domain-containing protein 3-like isoform X2 [Hibiscus syriacus]KAE8685252.1 tyrosine specific protein phosphatase [Hibiscus syriacus]
MPDNRQVQNNGVSNQSADNIGEAILRLKINDNNQEAGVSKSASYPDRPGEPDCSYYLRTGVCGYGNNCRFNHPTFSVQAGQYSEQLPERAGRPDCGYFIKTGTCKYGSTCKYHHPKDKNGAGPVIFNILGLPMRQDEKSCPYYMRTGSCKFGIACKFHHPQPASPGAGLPVNGPAGSTILPPSGVPYGGGLPTWSLPRVPYVSGQCLQRQSYMPVFVSPSQSMIPAPGWSTYVGTMNPVSSSGVIGSNLAYNSVNPAESGSTGQLLLSSSMPASNFPERPNQPECRYYMNTGTCKYGSDCKYHHPKERIANSVINGSGPLGLPSRPGQAVCSSYTMYGLCKYGPTCRFDHPYVGYPYNYDLSLPSSVFNSSALAYQSVPPTNHLSDTPLPSKPPDWARNTNSVSKKHQNTETKNSDDPVEQADSPHSLQISMKTSQDD